MVRHYWRVRTTQLSKSLGNKKLSDQQVIELNEFWKKFVDIDFSEHKFYLNACNEPVLIEANLCSGELDFHQLNNGPIFGDETKEILMEVFNRVM